MKFFSHNFRNFGTVERICMACGYVIPKTETDIEAKAWMIKHEGHEVHCGGAWHKFERKN